MNKARWLVSMAESDRAAFLAWAARCDRLGAATTMAGALRLAVKLSESLPDNDVKRGYA